MPDYEVILERTTVNKVNITITAEDEDAAATRAEELCDEITKAEYKGPTLEWELDSDDCSVDDIQEA